MYIKKVVYLNELFKIKLIDFIFWEMFILS